MGHGRNVLSWSALLAALLGLTGCTATKEALAPDEVFVNQKPQDYQFDVLWQSLIEAIEGEGYQIVESARDVSEERGLMASQLKEVSRDAVKDVTRAKRIQAQILPARMMREKFQGEGLVVGLAASDFEKADEDDEWEYLGPDDALRQKIEQGLSDSLAARYGGGN